ncbi:hypothetical protein [Spirillospora sp. NPDC047279]|uniref:hypothetical protein n=1 Tax=Spirillospora sp. NPDC047279 TaxID=3155478 RepID=UPI0033F87F2A
MATLNITYDGRSGDLPGTIERSLTDDDIRTLAVEVVRTGAIPGLHVPDLPPNAFRHFVVDRFGGGRVYLRPKVPFGA